MEYPFVSLGPALHVLALVILIALLAAGLAVVVYLAALPGHIATRRRHPQAAAVNICGWLGLPTGILWVAALAWAYWNHGSSSQAHDDGVSEQLASKLVRLEELVSELEQQQSGATV